MVDGPYGELPGLTGLIEAPLRLDVTGRPGAGRRTVSEAMRAAGAVIVTADQSPEVSLYVFADIPTGEDRDALSAMARQGRPCVAVLNKADLCGFRGAGPMAAATARCRALARDIGVPSAPLAALAARAGCRGLDDVILVGLRTLALDPSRLTVAMRRLLRADLDLYGLAHAVAAVRAGAAADGVADALRRASGVNGVMAAVERAGAAVRYRRLTSASALVISRIGSRSEAQSAVDAVAAARTALAVGVIRAAGMPVGEPDLHGAENDAERAVERADCLRMAVAWQRYARGPVGDLHRDCARDLSGAWLRKWAAVDAAARHRPGNRAEVIARRGELAQARLRLLGTIRTGCAELRAELHRQAGRLDRRGLSDFTDRTLARISAAVAEWDQTMTAEFDAILRSSGADVQALRAEPAPRIAARPPQDPDPTEVRLTVLIGAVFGVGAGLTVGRLLSDLVGGWAAAAGAVVGIGLTVWVIGSRRLLSERATMLRWTAEVLTVARQTLEERVAGQALAAEIALGVAAADRR